MALARVRDSRPVGAARTLVLCFACALLWAGCAAPPAAISGAGVNEPTATKAPPAEEQGERLVARHTSSPPEIDGQVEAAWQAAEPLSVPLTWGTEGTARALDVELRALHDEQALYLLARWPGERPTGAENTVYNQLTVHWRIPEPDAERLDCDVACHTVFADGQGRVAYANAETIPAGGSEALTVAGGGQEGTWALEWSRPLVSGNPFDLQLKDRERAYDFRVKVFARVEGRADPISKPHQLVFAP